jgi:hypothetical protein
VMAILPSSGYVQVKVDLGGREFADHEG